MAITNGYCTLDELKARLLEMLSYTADTISFTNATKTITDTAKGLRALEVGEIVEIEGTVNNDGFYTIATAGKASVTVEEALTDEAAGNDFTIRKAGNTFDDSVLENTITATSRHIDNTTERRFYASNETRYYTPQLSDLLFIDDLLSVTTLKTDTSGDGTFDTTWAATDYNLRPYNASSDGVPYTQIETTPQSGNSFNMLRRSVEIVGSFGFTSSTPAPVNEACLLLAARLFKRKDAPFGVTGTPDLGELRNIRMDDPDVYPLLIAYHRVIS